MFDTTQLKLYDHTRAPGRSAPTRGTPSSCPASAFASWPGPRRPAAASMVEHPIAPRTMAAPYAHARGRVLVRARGPHGALLGDDEVYAEPGDFVFKPRNQWHTFWNAGDEPCRILEIIARQVRAHVPRDGRADDVDPAKLADFSERYGIQFDPEGTARLPSASAWCRTTSRTRPLQLREDRLGLEVGVEVVVALLAADPRRLAAAERH